MIEKTIVITILSIIIGKIIYALPIMICAGIFLGISLNTIPNTYKKDKINKTAIILSEGFILYDFIQYGATLTMMRWLFLVCILAYASVYDIKTRTVPNFVSAMIFLIGFIGADEKKIPINIITGITALIFLIIVSVISNHKIGAGDIKIISALSFVSGPLFGIYGLIFGLGAGILGTIVRNKIKNTDSKTMALLPYISAGYLLSGMF